MSTWRDLFVEFPGEGSMAGEMLFQQPNGTLPATRL